MKLEWKNSTSGEGQEQDKITYGILESDEGEAYLCVTQIPHSPLTKKDSEHGWTTVSVETWDFERRAWNVDNALIQAITESRNLFSLIEDPDEFGAALTKAQIKFDIANPPGHSGGGKPSGTEGVS